MKLAILVFAPLTLAGCTAAQIASYTGAANATLAVVKQIGVDVVTFDCANAGLIYVIAKDANASARVQATLARNAQIAKDACPAMLGTASVVVQAGSVTTPVSGS